MSATEPSTTASKPSPYDLKRDRLNRRLADIDVEIATVHARHASDISDADARLQGARSSVDLEKTYLKQVEEGLVLLYNQVLGLRERISAAEEAILRMEEVLMLAAKNSATAQDALGGATKEHEERLREPRRHLAALQADRDKVQYRLTLHLARQPLTALFPGTKL